MPVVARLGPVVAVVEERRARLDLPALDACQRVELSSGGDGRVRLGLVLAVGGRAFDVSVQPGLLERCVRDTAAVDGGGDALVRRVAVWVAERAGAWGAWAPADPSRVGLVGVVGGAAFPLLGGLYDRGADPLREVPRWAVPVLGASTTRAAANVAFGARATRPVTRGLATSLVPPAPGAPVALAGLALGMLAADVLEPDELAALLGAAAGNTALVTGDDLRRGRSAVRAWGRAATARLLVDAAGSSERTRRLLVAFGLWEDVGRHGPARVPVRVDDLHRDLLARMPLDPSPEVPPIRRVGQHRDPPVLLHAAPPGDRPERRRRSGVARPEPVGGERSATPRAPRAAPPVEPPVPVGPRLAPVDGVLDTANTVLPVHDLGPLHGRSRGDLRLALPRTVGELTIWGRRLANCLGGYGEAVRRGRSRLVGVYVADRLAYCVELAPDGTVRQFLGARNRPPDPDHARTVLELIGPVRRRDRDGR